MVIIFFSASSTETSIPKISTTVSSSQVVPPVMGGAHQQSPLLPYMAPSVMNISGQLSNQMGVAQTSMLIPPTQGNNMIRPSIGASPASLLAGGNIHTHSMTQIPGLTPPTSTNIQQQSMLGQYPPQPLLPIHMMYPPPSNVPPPPGILPPNIMGGALPPVNSPFQSRYITPPTNQGIYPGSALPITTTHMTNYTPTGKWK